MKIGLSSSTFVNNDTVNNLQTMMKTMEEYAGRVDLLCFGEAFLQGFDAFSWIYNNDKNIAIDINNVIIIQLKNKCIALNLAISFGYLERDNDNLYSSYLFIGNDGQIINNYRRVSIGWKEFRLTDHHYQEGNIIAPFTYYDKRIIPVLCGYLWNDEVLSKVNKIEKDFVLWPVYVNYDIDSWLNGELDGYLEHVKVLGTVLLINSISNKPDAFGGCYHIRNGEIINQLPMGNDGVLIIEL